MQLEFYSSRGQLLLTHQYTGGVCTIGRGRRVDVMLRDRSVSRQHAEIRDDGAGVSILDLDSRQGLWREKERVRHYGPLSPGDVMEIGRCRLHILAAAAEEGVERSDATSCTGPDGDAAEPATPNIAPVDGGESFRTPAMIELCKSFQERIADTLNLYRRNIIDELSGERLREEARSAAEQVLQEERIQVPQGVDRESLLQVVIAETVGLGPLEPLMADAAVSEIMVNGPDDIYVERAGRLEASTQRFTSSNSLMNVIDRIITPLGRRIDEGSPLVDARLPDGSRMNAIIPPLSLIGPVLTIRKFMERKFGLEDLIQAQGLSRAMVDFLMVCIAFRKNVVVSGGTGTGKTTFLNALSEHIPERERIVTIEDSAEIKLDQEHVISLESRPANIEGTGQISIRDLVKNALRMRPDRIIVGECRSGEALDMLQAMNTGHDGSLTTAHANSPRDALSRLEVMTLMAGMELPSRAIREQLASAIDVIVQLSRFPDGRRCVTSITEVDGMEGDAILTQELFRFEQTAVNSAGEVLGRFEGTGMVPRFYEGLRRGGVDLDLSIFQPPGGAG